MGTFTITGADTLVLDGRVFNDLAEGDTSAITFPEELVKVKTGKNENTLYALNAAGSNGNLIIRLVRGSSDDQYMANILKGMKQDFPSTKLLSGSFTKRLGDGAGNVINDVYPLVGGMIVKNVDGKENVDGDLSQAVSIYALKFANADRNIE